MARTISAGLDTHLAGTLLTLAFCAKVTRRDGTVLGFTSADRPFTFEAVDYEPASTVLVSATRSSLGTGIDNLDATGLLSSGRITDVDLRAGRYDRARVDLFFVNYLSLTDGKVTLVGNGVVGEVNFSDGTWTMEIRSLFQTLAQQVVELTSELCRVKRFLDQRCNGDGTIDPTTVIFTKSVTAVTDALTLTFGSDSAATDFYTYGEVEFRGGANDKFIREVKAHTLVSGEAKIVLQEAFPFAVAVGDVAVLTAGCNRTIDECITKFANAANFRGHPYLPGTDQLGVRGRR